MYLLYVLELIPNFLESSSLLSPSLARSASIFILTVFTSYNLRFSNL